MLTAFFSESFEPDANRIIAEFVSQRIFGEIRSFGPFCSMGVFDNGGLIAGVIYHDYQPQNGTIEISAASDSKRWMTRPVIRDFLWMPFDRLGCQCIVARHSVEKESLRRMWKALGAEEFIVPRLRGRDAPPEAITILTEEAWTMNKHSGRQPVEA